MRQAKLYTVAEQDIIVSGDTYQLYEKPSTFFPIYVQTDGELSTVYTVEAIDIPVHHFRRVEAGVRKDDYIAVEPKLREMIESALAVNYNRALQAMDERLMIEGSMRIGYERRIEAFNSLPWYKRIFRKV